MVKNSHTANQLHRLQNVKALNRRGSCLDIGVAPTQPRSPSASVHVCERLHLGSRNSFLHCLHNMRITAPTYTVSWYQPGLKLGQVTGVLLWVYCSISHKSHSAIVQRTGPRAVFLNRRAAVRYRAARGSPGICHFSFLSIFHE